MIMTTCGEKYWMRTQTRDYPRRKHVTDVQSALFILQQKQKPSYYCGDYD